MPSNWLNLTRAASALRGTGLGFSAGRPPKPEPDPLREELLSPEQLVEHSRSLAHEHAVAVDGRPTLSLLRGIRESARILSLTFEGVAAAFFFSSRRRHTRFDCDWSSDVCSSD